MHICTDCKFGHGHPLLYCPGCGKKLITIPMSTDEYRALKEQSWKFEGQSNLYEYFINGVKVDASEIFDRYKIIEFNGKQEKRRLNLKECVVATLAPIVISLFPAFNLNIDNFQTDIWELSRKYSLRYVNKDNFTITFDKPVIRWRLAGSNIDVGSSDDINNIRKKIGLI